MLLTPQTLRELVLEGAVDIQANVERIDHHYAHKNTVRSDISSWEWTNDGMERYGGEDKDERLLDAEFGLDDQIKALDEELLEYVRELCDKIYAELEAEYDSRQEDEYVEEMIRANDWKFDEDGNCEWHDEGLEYDQLSDEAKETAREKVRESETGDEWWDFIYDDWKERLEKKGFMVPDIAFSGFWSQGDGASFTCKYVDFQRYFSEYDPLKPD